MTNHDIDVQVALAMGWHQWDGMHDWDGPDDVTFFFADRQWDRLQVYEPGSDDINRFVSFTGSHGDVWEVIEYQRKQWPQTVGKPAKYWQFVSLRDDLWSVMIREENATVARVIARDVGPFPLAVCRCFLTMARAPQGEAQ